MFWPILSKNTEPDLVIIVGDWYLLIEAKFNSDFGEETLTRASQLDRELDEGGFNEYFYSFDSGKRKFK